MANIDLDHKRRAILDADGHLLIEGGPGCGKTTIALLKASAVMADLGPEQRVLFLSFSRAAVRQVTDRMPGVIMTKDSHAIEVRTFHAFFLEIVRSHGRLLTGQPAKFVTPERESQLRAEYEGDWSMEVDRLAREESLFVFDTLARTAAELLERSATVRKLYSSIYPLVIVDEFQDTNIDQWRVVKALASGSTIICLADPDQRIFEHLDGVDEHRILEAEKFLTPARFDLSSDNHRSPGGGILDYANALLHNNPMVPPSEIAFMPYRYEYPEARAHFAVLTVRHILSQELNRIPTVAVLTRSNSLAGRVSEALSKEQTLSNGNQLTAVDHVLLWDPELSAASGFVVASVLEWPLMGRTEGVVHTLNLISDYYRVKLGHGTLGARKQIMTLQRGIETIRAGRTPVSKTAKLLLDKFDDTVEFIGRPVRDWQIARSRLGGSPQLDEVFKQARLLRLLHATDALAWTLLDAWDGVAGYRDAADAVRTALANEAVNAARQDPPLVSVMTMHKSKGKEFDAVVIVEGRYGSPLVSEEPKNQDADRRLLRVAITRARYGVVFVRPHDATPLTRAR